MDIHKSIFITNTFANSFPDLHVKLWNQFEKETPLNKRNGYYGAENVAYISYIRKVQDASVKEFFDKHLTGMQSN